MLGQVPIDVPQVAFEMMYNFLYQVKFDADEQSLSKSGHQSDDCPVCPQCINSTIHQKLPGTLEGGNLDRKQSKVIRTVGVSVALVMLLLMSCRLRRRTQRHTTFIIPDDDIELS